MCLRTFSIFQSTLQLFNRNSQALSPRGKQKHLLISINSYLLWNLLNRLSSDAAYSRFLSCSQSRVNMERKWIVYIIRITLPSVSPSKSNNQSFPQYIECNENIISSVVEENLSIFIQCSRVFTYSFLHLGSLVLMKSFPIYRYVNKQL